MPFVKLDCGILDSTLWVDRDARELFITALLMAQPKEFTEPQPQIEIDSLEVTGWEVPPDWYGFVPAAGVGIIRRAGLPRPDGFAALMRLGMPEVDSRSKDYEGRRLVRVDGGFVVLNFIKYRARDYTAADRQRRYRERMKKGQTSQSQSVTSHRNVTPKSQSQSQSDTNKETLSSSIVLVFTRWQEIHNHPRAKLTHGRRDLIRRRLTEYSVEDLIRAVEGYEHSAHHMGENDRNTRYDSIELMLRDAAHIEAGWSSGQKANGGAWSWAKVLETAELVNIVHDGQEDREPFTVRVMAANQQRIDNLDSR